MLLPHQKAIVLVRPCYLFFLKCIKDPFCLGKTRQRTLFLSLIGNLPKCENRGFSGKMRLGRRGGGQREGGAEEPGFPQHPEWKQWKAEPPSQKSFAVPGYRQGFLSYKPPILKRAQSVVS